MKNSGIKLLLLCLITGPLQAQKFWQPTPTFPGGPKLSIALAGDSCLFVSLPSALLRSCDQGFSWDTVWSGHPLSALAATHHRVFAGSVGEIYYSDDLGEQWQKVKLPTVYPLQQIYVAADGNLYGLAGILDSAQGYLGSGVLRSQDNGLSWTTRNQGLGNFLHGEIITSDRYGRLYLAVADESRSGGGGLFFSDNQGQNWQAVNVQVDGRGAIPSQILLGNTLGLSVSPEDSLYLSFEGSAGNVGVSLNVHKHLSDIPRNNYWTVKDNGGFIIWYNDRLMNNIHFAKNGNAYSSGNGSIFTGGSYFSRDFGHHWQRHQYGLGLNIFGQFSQQSFVENSKGTIFMVQYLDERIYKVDSSGPISLSPPDLLSGLTVFPNPSAGKVILQIPKSLICPWEIKIFNAAGQRIHHQWFTEVGDQELLLPDAPGLYMLEITAGGHRALCKIWRK